MCTKRHENQKLDPNAFCVAWISVHEIWESKKAKIKAAVFHMSMAESYARDLLKLQNKCIIQRTTLRGVKNNETLCNLCAVPPGCPRVCSVPRWPSPSRPPGPVWISS